MRAALLLALSAPALAAPVVRMESGTAVRAAALMRALPASVQAPVREYLNASGPDASALARVAEAASAASAAGAEADPPAATGLDEFLRRSAAGDGGEGAAESAARLKALSMRLSHLPRAAEAARKAGDSMAFLARAFAPRDFQDPVAAPAPGASGGAALEFRLKRAPSFGAAIGGKPAPWSRTGEGRQVKSALETAREKEGAVVFDVDARLAEQGDNLPFSATMEEFSRLVPPAAADLREIAGRLRVSFAGIERVAFVNSYQHLGVSSPDPATFVILGPDFASLEGVFAAGPILMLGARASGPVASKSHLILAGESTVSVGFQGSPVHIGQDAKLEWGSSLHPSIEYRTFVLPLPRTRK